jgi:hypothetical protein
VEASMADASNVKRDFFISFNNADRAWAHWIAWNLEEAGYSVFFQDWDFTGNFVIEMDRAHNNSNRTIAVLSPDYLSSRFVAPEWAARFAEDAISAQDLLILFRVRECKLEGLLSAMIYVDLFDVDEKTAQEKLLQRIRNIRRKPSYAPVFPPEVSVSKNTELDASKRSKLKNTEEVMVFLSYTRIDNEFFNGYISSLKNVLEGAVRVVTGNKKFVIFQDVDHIELGQKWRERIKSSLGRSRCLIPILTPNFFTSEMCREELNQFFEREKSGSSADLILPIYLLTADEIEDEEKRKSDPLAKELSERQWFDWRPYMDLPLDDQRARQASLQFAKGIAGVLNRSF